MCSSISDSYFTISGSVSLNFASSFSPRYGSFAICLYLFVKFLLLLIFFSSSLMSRVFINIFTFSLPFLYLSLSYSVSTLLFHLFPSYVSLCAFLSLTSTLFLFQGFLWHFWVWYYCFGHERRRVCLLMPTLSLSLCRTFIWLVLRSTYLSRFLSYSPYVFVYNYFYLSLALFLSLIAWISYVPT